MLPVSAMSIPNPYQAPSFEPPPTFAAHAAQPGEPLRWDITEAIAVGWDRTKRWWPILVFAPLLVQVVVQGLDFGLIYTLDQLGLGDTFAVFRSIAVMIVAAYLGVGVIRISLAAARGEEPRWSLLFSGGDRLGQYIVTQLIVGLAVLGSLFAFIVPGIIVALGFSMSLFVCIDRGTPALESMKASWAMMRGSKMRLFGYSFVCLFLFIGGLLALLVGAFAVIGICYVSMAWIYLRVSGEVTPDRVS